MNNTSDKWQLDESVHFVIEHRHQYIHAHEIGEVSHLHGGAKGVVHTHKMDVVVTENGYEILHPTMDI